MCTPDRRGSTLASHSVPGPRGWETGGRRDGTSPQTSSTPARSKLKPAADGRRRGRPRGRPLPPPRGHAALCLASPRSAQHAPTDSSEGGVLNLAEVAQLDHRVLAHLLHQPLEGELRTRPWRVAQPAYARGQGTRLERSARTLPPGEWHGMPSRFSSPFGHLRRRARARALA